MKSKIGVRSRVSMLVSDIVDAPMVVGWLRPLVLVPATAFTSLTPDQLQTVLAHELQHIARRDHLVNMLQAFIEVLLFFHPVTWWLSRQIRVERENCCDDGALLVTGSPRTFAEALLVLESLRADHQTTSPQLLTATGGSLMHRVSRLFGSSQPQPLNAGWRAVSACTLLAVAGLTFATATTGPTAIAQDRGGSDARDRSISTNSRPKHRSPNQGHGRRSPQAGRRRRDQRGRRQGRDSRQPRRRMWMRYRAAEEENTSAGGSQRDYDAAVKKMTKMVEDGTITREQMQQRLGRMKQAGSSKTDRVDLDELKAGIEARIKAMGADLRKQVAAGEISEADAKARFAEGEKRMWMRYRAAEAKHADAIKNAATSERIDLDELKTKIEERLRTMGMDLRKQVAAGEISEADAKARFEEGEKRMWMRYRAAEAKNADAMKKTATSERIDLDGLKTKIEERLRTMGMDLRKQVAAGEISEEDAKARFDEGEKRMWMRYRAAEAKNAEAMKKTASERSMSDYDAAVRKMTEMVKNGEMTREQMQQRLDRMKQADSKDEEAGDRRRSMSDYDAAVRKMTEMVKNGEMTREQMQQRLDRMKQAGE